MAVKMLSFPTFFLLFFACISCLDGSYVQELDNRFVEIKNQGSWLVEFYAPWCGYCRKLEPIWEEVGRVLYGTSINVAKVDATIYTGIAREFNVRGFPTIKFIKGGLVLTYQGDRTAEDIVQFANKAGGPAVTELTSGEQLRSVQRDRTVFFLLVTNSQGNDDYLKEVFTNAAEKRVTEGYFYTILEKDLPKAVKLTAPVISVFKDGSNFPFQIKSKIMVDNVTTWIDQEKYSAFIQITRSNIHDISETGKSILFTVFAEDKSKKKENERVGKIAKLTAYHHRDKYHRLLQFGWTLGDEITTNIMMSSMTAPYIMVYNTTTLVYYLLPYKDIKDSFIEEMMVTFLDNVLSGKERGYGGDSYLQRLIRCSVLRVFKADAVDSDEGLTFETSVSYPPTGVYSIVTSAYEIWTLQPIIASIMFGLPLFLFICIAYTLCTAEEGDDQDYNEDEFDDEDDNVENRDTLDSPPQAQEQEATDKQPGKPKTE